MQSLAAILGTAFDVAVVLLGFGLVVLVHELGHFFAARWAGIRVLAMAIGFGPALVSYRRGVGFCRGSASARLASGQLQPPADATALGHTEYRLNALPFGGYVRMLGQDDLHPAATSTEPDSYQRCPIWKRMIVISAGVVANVVLAAVVFVAVFTIGLEVSPPQIGAVLPGSPASRAVPLNARELGIDEPGLRSGDRIERVNGRPPNSFNDLVLAAAMSRPGRPVQLTIRRDGLPDPIEFRIAPEPGSATGLLELGVEPPRSATLIELRSPAERAAWTQLAESIGLSGVEPGMTLVRVGSIEPVRSAQDLRRAMDQSGGEPVQAVFAGPAGRVSVALQPRAQLQRHLLARPGTSPVVVEHLLGLVPVLAVGPVGPADRAYRLGLRTGDVFVLVGSVEFPRPDQGAAEIRAHAGRDIDLIVWRRPPGAAEPVELSLTVPVTRRGMIGFPIWDTAETDTLLARPPAQLIDPRDGSSMTPPAAEVIRRPGSRLVAINGRPVTSLVAARQVLREATASAAAQGADATVTLTLQPPQSAATVEPPPRDEVTWHIPPAHVAALHALGWSSPLPLELFELEQTTLRADSPLSAAWMGLRETHRVMMTTYLTLARLFEGTIRVEHVKGPVGIAHLGTRIAERGPVWLAFLMALISVNLAVINFLPLPIVDGGQFVMLLWEQLVGRPIPVAVQNAISLVGLLLIGVVFVVVTYNDIANLLSG